MSVIEQVTATRQRLSSHLRRLVHRQRLPELLPPDQQIVSSLSRAGACATTLEALGLPGSEELLSASDRLVGDMERLPKRSDNKSYLVAAPAGLITNYPEIIRWGLDERLLAIAECYIGTPVTYRGVLARLDFPDGVVDETRLWHLDQEDARILKVIVYLDDVDAAGGPFEYVPADVRVPHRLAKGSKLRIDAEEDLAAVVPRRDWRAITGPRGTVGFADTCRVLHRGRLPTGGTRKSLFFCYNSKSPFSPSYCAPLFQVDRFLEQAGTLSPRQRRALEFPYLQ